MTQYLLSVHMCEGDQMPAPEVIEHAYKAVDAFNTELQDQGAWVFAGGLQPHTTATVVTARDGEVLTTDGPFAECKERLAGFWVVRAADLRTAQTLAAKGSAACGAPVEVRPFEGELEP